MNSRIAVITGAARPPPGSCSPTASTSSLSRVTLTAPRPPARLSPRRPPGHTVHALHTGLVDRAGVRALGARLRDLVGHVDVLINNAGAAFAQLTVYGSAKLLGILTTAALADRLPADMAAYSATPGVIKTGFNAKSGGLLKAVAAVSGLFAQAPDKAARTPVPLATSRTKPTPNGGFFARGTPADSPKAARDRVLAAAVYERCVRGLGVGALPPRAKAEFS